MFARRALHMQSAVLLCCASSFAQNVNNPDLLQSLLTENESSRELIDSCSFTYIWESSIPAVTGNDDEMVQLATGRQSKGTARTIIHGQDRHILLQATSAKLDGTQMQIREHEAVLNKDYFGICDTSPGVVFMCEQYDRPASTEAQSQFEGTVSSGFWFDVFRYGFGTGDEYLQDAVKSHPESIRWQIEQEGDALKGLYKLTRYTPRTLNPDQADTEYWIDASKGHLITKVRSYEPSGNVWLMIDVVPREFTPGRWIPAEINEIRQGAKLKLSVTEFAVPISKPAAEQFTWNGFAADLEQVTVARWENAMGVSTTAKFSGRKMEQKN